MKPITHARKEMMAAYFEVLEIQLRRGLKDAAVQGTSVADPATIKAMAQRVQERMSAVMAEMPDATAPSLPQICKNLENVLTPPSDGEKFDPILALRTLREELRFQPAYTKPKGGNWQPASQLHRRKAR